ncbi:act minimal PKS acyl carrier protein [Allocatelliglobosispora scoriae]|uniref:Act minimal PKS acyl carrier protein n=1 Tax=Allocatelliglobosispora scoriae TaxID=643052 RepID=A0A841BI80_9ACTN|nr:acyl carrier protein [Allocatelliglobosispora scoriae]MBB5867325.1 act minimal PKS acyl carrier protein [Allocatelliglobosispora scoriae]
MSSNATLRLESIQELANMGRTGQRVVIDQSMLDDDFDDLGVDSLALIELVDRIQEAHRVRVDDDEVSTLRTPRLLLAHVNGLLKSRAR